MTGYPLNQLPQTDNFLSIVLENRPLIDVRAPIEYEKGSFPHTVNMPLMSNQERHKVGACYKKYGNQKALELGYSLVSGEIKASRVQACLDFISSNPNAYIYCHRGGQRSSIMQQWIAEAGVSMPRIMGGQKAFRNYLMQQTVEIGAKKEIIVVGGRTGSGKTILLNRLEESIDLEGLANHRGSSFGRHVSAQPTQIDFESALSYAIIQHDDKGYNRLIVEDESRNIGHCFIPHELFDNISQSSVVLLEESLDRRIEITYDEYIIASQSEFSGIHDNEYTWIETMRHNFKRISKRLGEQGYRELTDMLESAWMHQKSTNDATEHKSWIEALLHRYYDPMYDYQLEQKKDRIVFRGDSCAVMEYLAQDI